LGARKKVTCEGCVCRIGNFHKTIIIIGKINYRIKKVGFLVVGIVLLLLLSFFLIVAIATTEEKWVTKGHVRMIRRWIESIYLIYIPGK
jgi:hypothetical protein